MKKGDFMKMYLLSFLFILSACGPQSLQQGPQGIPGPAASSVASLEGYYVLPNGGYLDIYQDAEGLYTIRQARIVMLNTDGSSGLVPIGSTGALPMTNGSLYYNVSPNYVAATNNIRQDQTSNQLSGALLTEMILSHSGTGIQVSITVNASNGVLFNHLVVSQ